MVDFLPENRYDNARAKAAHTERCKDMINFEEELAKFKPSLEVDETEKAILNDKMVDITDILQELMNEMNEIKK